MATVSAALLILGSVVIALLVLAMVFYEEILVALAWVLQGLFVVGFVMATSSLFLEPPYRWTATWLVARTGAPDGLRYGDDFVRSVRDLPADLWQKLRSSVTKRSDALEPLFPGDLPTIAPPPGTLETTIVPALNASLAASLRFLSFAGGMFLMVVALMFRSATDLILQLRALRRRIAELEEAAERP
jgi:hypothetical protein